MRAISLLLLRISTGLYLILWGLVKLNSQEVATSVSDKYYGGLISSEMVNLGVGGLEILVGLLVMLGIARNISYPAQVIWYLAGLIPIIPYILDPFGAYLVESARLTFFPSTTLLFASLVLLAFKEYDTLSVGHRRAG